MSLLGNIWVRLGLKADDFNRGLDNAEKKTSKFGTLMKGVAARVLSVAAAFKAVASTVRTLVSFEASVSKLASVLGKTAGEISGLTQSAIDLGRKTQYTASEVVGLQTELAKLGFTEVQIKSMQESVLKFAAAVGTDLPSAAARAGATMRGFGLTAEQTGDLLEVMAVSTSKSALSFNYLDSTLGKLVPVTKAYGFDAKDTITLLGTLANAGIDASSAGTALRRVFAELANSGNKLNNALGKQPKTMEELIAGLQKLKAGGLGVKESFDLVGKYAGSAFAALVNGADDCANLYTELQNTNGALNEMYKTMTQNVTGAVNELKSAWEGFILNLQASNGVIARMVRGLTKLVNVANKLMFRDTRVGENKSFYDLLWNGHGGFDDNSFTAVTNRFAKERQRIQNEQEKLRSAYEESLKNQGNYAQYRNVPVEETKAWKRLSEELDGLEQSYSDWFETVIQSGAEAGGVLDGLGDSIEGENDSFEELLKKMGKEKEYLKDSIGWLQKEIRIRQERRDEATDRNEIQTLNTEIALLQKKVNILQNVKELSVLPNVSAPTGKAIAPANTGIGVDLKHTEEEVDDFLEKLRSQQEEAENIANGFASALQNGIVGALDELAEAIGTGDWDTAALVSALLNPIADMAISAGVIVSGVGDAVEALKTSLTSLQGPIAIAAGAALIAAGVAAKAGLAALAKKGGKGGASSGGSAYTYTGGYGSVPLAGAGYGSSMELSGTVTVKGQDLQIALDNYNKNRKR